MGSRGSRLTCSTRAVAPSIPASRVSYDVRRAPEASPASLRPPVAVPRPQPPAASKIVFKREQDRTRALPLTYREYVYVAPSGTTEAAAEALSYAASSSESEPHSPTCQRESSSTWPSSTRPFEGKPTVPPMATLEWKDWRDAETVTFPRHAAEHVAPTVPPATAPAIASVVVQGDPFAHPKVATSSTSSAPPPPAPLSQPRRGSTPRLRAPGVPSPRRRPHRRPFRSNERFALPCATPSRRAIFAWTQVMERLPCQVGLVHLYDIDRREFVITNAQGSGANASSYFDVIPRANAMLSKAMRGETALVIVPRESVTSPIDRYQSLGGPVRSVIVAPAMQAGRFLGAMSFSIRLDGLPFTEARRQRRDVRRGAARRICGDPRRRHRS
jgi:hypothetical protein